MDGDVSLPSTLCLCLWALTRVIVPFLPSSTKFGSWTTYYRLKLSIRVTALPMEHASIYLNLSMHRDDTSVSENRDNGTQLQTLSSDGRITKILK